jgi:hypothetical protein
MEPDMNIDTNFLRDKIRSLLKKEKPKQRDKQKDMENLLENYPSSSSFAESYRTLRTNLFFAAMGKELKAVVIYFKV